MKLNFGAVPFSYAGSYMAFSYPQDKARGYEKNLTLRTLFGMFDDQQNFPIYLRDPEGNILDGDVTACETELSLSHGKYYLKICFQNADTIIFRANTQVVITKRRLSGSERVMVHDYGMCEIAGDEESLALEISKGSFTDHSVLNEKENPILKVLLKPAGDRLEGQLTLTGLNYKRPPQCSYEEALCETVKSYKAATETISTTCKKYQEAMAEAAYINWHAIVNPNGYIKYPVMLMTKNVMNQVWSWDYAINALAMADKNPELAYQQFLAMIECQDPHGTYPDCFQARTMIRSYVKPPIQGFILQKMFEIKMPGNDILKRLYQSVTQLTNWWIDFRGRKDGIPEYNHGNDSGWDNSTVFRCGYPVKSPDLCAWLVEQMYFLSRTARLLGLIEESEDWAKRGEALLAKMLEYFVVDHTFAAYKEPEHKVVENNSLLLYIPLILGERLPEDLRKNMLDKLLTSGKFITDYGIASEPVDSEYFIEDGYWRGAIWPPTAFIMTELLMKNGKTEEALKNAESFCDLCAERGFYENYNAIDGRGLRDSGFTWTASVFMILLRDYLEK